MMKAKAKIRPGRVIDGTAAYLVRLDDNPLFFARESGDGRPLGTRYPSAAWRGSYLEADALVQKFRAEGFKGPVVTDLIGRMVDNAALEEERQREAERSRNFWGS